MKPPPACRTTRAIWVMTLILLYLGMTTVTASNVRKTDDKPTSNIVFQYRKLITDGTLLSPDGWQRASLLFSRAISYPPNGPIEVTYTGGPIAEDFVKADRGQVESKWDEDYGTVDSQLRYSSPKMYCALVNIYPLVRIKGEWKLEGPLDRRSASIESVIRYLQKIATNSNNSTLKGNAQRTIRTLKKLLTSRKGASAC